MKWILNFFKEKPLVAFIILAAIIFILYKVISGWIAKAKAKGNYTAAVNQSQTALTQLATKGVTPSYAQSQYSTWADAIEQGFSGCGTGWSSVLQPTLNQMKNDADVFALIQAYGVRDIDECGWGSFQGDLGATIGYKFSGFRFCDQWYNPTCDACGCVGTINQILKSKSIVFQF